MTGPMHAFAMLCAFLAGGFSTLYFAADTVEDMNAFGWSALGLAVMSLIVFAAAVSL